MEKPTYDYGAGEKGFSKASIDFEGKS